MYSRAAVKSCLLILLCIYLTVSFWFCYGDDRQVTPSGTNRKLCTVTNWTNPNWPLFEQSSSNFAKVGFQWAVKQNWWIRTRKKKKKKERPVLYSHCIRGPVPTELHRNGSRPLDFAARAARGRGAMCRPLPLPRLRCYLQPVATGGKGWGRGSIQYVRLCLCLLELRQDPLSTAF